MILIDNYRIIDIAYLDRVLLHNFLLEMFFEKMKAILHGHGTISNQVFIFSISYWYITRSLKPVKL